MAKFVLDNEAYYDFKLVGISSHVQDYRICWTVNKALSLDLVKMDEEIIIRPAKADGLVSFSVYYCFDEETEVEFELISNRHEDGFLIPEMRTADYFLKISEWYSDPISEIIQKLRKENLVNMAFEVDLETLRSKQNLVYK